MRVVLDTNIIVSGLAYAGNERRVIELARGAQFELFLSTHILRELEGVMPRKFDWPSERVSRNINNLRSIATIIESPPPSSSEQITNHAEDDRILDCVAAAEADFLVTGDRRHLLPLRAFGNARIVTAADFLEVLEAQGS